MGEIRRMSERQIGVEAMGNNAMRLGCAALLVTASIAASVWADNGPAKWKAIEWSVNAREPAGVGFAVERAGPIQAAVNVEGTVPVSVELLRGDGRVVARASGTSKLTIAHAVTTDDVKAGALWQVRFE